MNNPIKPMKACNPQTVSFLFFFLFAPGLAEAQSSPAAQPRSLPLVSAVSEAVFLGDAQKSSARAQHFKNTGQPVNAIGEYEGLITSSEKLGSGLMHSYEYYVTIAGAHLDAASLCMTNASFYGQNLKLTDENRARIESHLAAVPNLAVAAAKASPKFSCQAYKLLGAGLFLRGTFNRNSKDLLDVIEIYKKIAACDKASAARASEMISYAKSVEANVSKRTFRLENIAKVASKVASLAVPRVGSYLAIGIEFAYESYEEKRKASVPVAPR